MIRFGVEVSDLVQTSEEVRKNLMDLLYAINEKDRELSHTNFLFVKLSIDRLAAQTNALTRVYDMALADDAAKSSEPVR